MQQTTFPDTFFLGALRVKRAYRSSFEVPTKTHLLKSSAANNCIILLTKLRVEANSVDPDQTATGAVYLGSHCLSKTQLKHFSRRQNQTTCVALFGTRDLFNISYSRELYLFSKFLHFEEIVRVKMAACFEMTVSET